MLHESEVQEGLALRMDPEVLLSNGAVVTSDARHRATGPHWFVCVGRRGARSEWVATSSKPAPERVLVTRKWGHRAWMGMETWADPYQVWTVSGFGAIRAAALGVDRSRRGARNFGLLDGARVLGPAA